MPRGNRTEEQLRAFAEEHLNYEYNMLMATAAMLSNTDLPQHEINAFLESFTIHLRALIDFVWSPNKIREDDAIAGDYFGSPDEWLKVKPNFPEILKPAQNRTGKEIAHLTYARMDVTPETKKWPVGEMANAMSSALAIFAKNANCVYLGNALSELK